MPLDAGAMVAHRTDGPSAPPRLPSTDDQLVPPLVECQTLSMP